MDSSDGISQPRLNPYAPPKSSVQGEQNDGVLLASRWYRLFARLIDTMLVELISWQIMNWIVLHLLEASTDNYFRYGYFWFSSSPPFYISFLVSFGVIAALNTYLLAKRGQTIGKYLLKIRIVRYYSDEVPKVRFSLVIREGIMLGLNLFGYLGVCIALINLLLIFSNNRRCLHDYCAFTKVVRVDKNTFLNYPSPVLTISTG